MTGEELYEMYFNEMEKQRVQIYTWEDLDGRDTDAWNALAEKLERKEE